MEQAQIFVVGSRGSQEMMQKAAPLNPAFFKLRPVVQERPRPRPISVATEFVDTDMDDEEEDDGRRDEEEDEEIIEDIDSPRCSLKSAGGPSISTLSSYDEAQTPRSSRSQHLTIDIEASRQVSGPRGPHLFRHSDPSALADEADVLSLSPITPIVDEAPDNLSLKSPTRASAMVSASASAAAAALRFTDERPVPGKLVSWTPQMVAQSMVEAGIDVDTAGAFIGNDISGEILLGLRFEHLKELGIHSLGVRMKVWNHIDLLQDATPVEEERAPTPIEDTPSREVRREGLGGGGGGGGGGGCDDEPGASPRPRPRDGRDGSSRSRSQRKKRSPERDVITPLESVSIVGIEQAIPKPHHCSKGSSCSRHRRQQRRIEAFARQYPFVDINAGTIVIGDPGNPQTARALDLASPLRPVSDAVPSLVASSDVLGPGTAGMAPPLQYLEEEALRRVASRDPQDNVRQFLDFQHQKEAPALEPPTPPFEVAAALRSPHRRLPRLEIPHRGSSVRRATPSQAREEDDEEEEEEEPVTAIQQEHQQYQQQQEHQQYHQQQQQNHHHQQQQHHYQQHQQHQQTEEHSNPYRFGTPFSEMDVPVTAVPTGPVTRSQSQSVPPDMSYRSGPADAAQAQAHAHAQAAAAAAAAGAAPPPPPPRTQSRTSARRPSFPVLPRLDENNATTSISRSKTPSLRHQPLHAPPRFHYPWSPLEPRNIEHCIPPPPSSATTPSSSSSSSTSPARSALTPTETSAATSATTVSPVSGGDGSGNGVSYQGHMKKRRTRMLRHEWQDGFFTIRGTRLAMHPSAREASRTLEYIDVDDYAIACSGLATSSKLRAAWKAMHNRSGAAADDAIASFSFQLIPQDRNAAAVAGRLRKRDSSVGGGAGAVAPGESGVQGVNGTGKTHHFAVKSREERIDWMRELMLAKALKQKGAGFEVSVNGNMI